MRMICEKTMKFLRDSYRKTIEDWCDDPDDQFTGWTYVDFINW